MADAKSSPSEGPAGARGINEQDTKQQTAERQRQIQREQDERDHATARESARPAQGRGEAPKGVQAGAVRQPDTMPAQHIAKPAAEHELQDRPRFMAEQYRGSGKLVGFATLITGGDSGIGRAVAVLFAREGADVAIVYLSSTQDAEEIRRCVEEEGRRCVLIQGDVTSSAFCNEAVARTVDAFGRFDVLVNTRTGL